jgi:cytosine/adenosine deaminase-related metal-dependent hydrolase
MSVAHCPRSHDYFQHQPFPYDILKKVGVNICLGTDSLASTKSSFKDPAKLDLFAEMRTFRKFHPNVDPETIIRMATVNGAQALRLERVAGQLSEGFNADMIAIPYSGAVENAYESVLEHRGPVLASIRNGRWIYGSAVLRDLSDPTDPKRTGNED